MKLCPTCRRPLPPAIQINGRRGQQVYDYIASHPGCDRESIVRAVYADDPNGGPESATIISTIVWKINLQLEQYDMRIMSRGGPGSTYELKPFRRGNGTDRAGRPAMKLTKEIVRQIQRSCMSVRSIAHNYGISKDTAWKIKRGEHALCRP